MCDVRRNSTNVKETPHESLWNRELSLRKGQKEEE